MKTRTWIALLLLFTILGLFWWNQKHPQGAREEIIPRTPAPLVTPSPGTGLSYSTSNIALPTASPTISMPAAKVSEVAHVEELPNIDQIHRLFALDGAKLPIVETIAYTSRVPWLPGRSAWLADYASHYATSRHFIARSLNGKPDYLTQKISPGDRFNVLRADKNIGFHLLIDLSRCRMWFYYIDHAAKERVLLKTYPIGAGRVDPKSLSGYLTPLGKYRLGDKIGIYKSGATGLFQGKTVEMITVFGTRWLPFSETLEGCTASAKGLGLHGLPWILDRTSNQLVEDMSKLGKWDSDGCIRLASADIEEIFAIVITKPTVVEIVRDFHDAQISGPTR